MSETPPEKNTNHQDNDETRAMDSTSSLPPRRPPQELPRRGYEGQPRPMSPPPPPPESYPPPAPSSPPPERPPAPKRRTPAAPSSPPPSGIYDSSPPPSPSRHEQVSRPQPPPPAGVSRSDSGLYLPWWSLLILVTVVGAGACGLLYGATELADRLVLGDQTPQFKVVTSEPLANNNAGAGNQNTGANNPVPPGSVPDTAVPVNSTSVPIAEPTDTLPPGIGDGCPQNVTAQVTGVGTVGLSIRSEPIQQDANILEIARDGDLFRIVDGPQFSTGPSGRIEWCRVQGITNESLDGWAARQYLAVLE